MKRYQARVQYLLPEFGIPSRRHLYTYGTFKSVKTAYRVARIMAWLHDYVICRTTRDWGIEWQVKEV